MVVIKGEIIMSLGCITIYRYRGWSLVVSGMASGALAQNEMALNFYLSIRLSTACLRVKPNTLAIFKFCVMCWCIFGTSF